jgi:hypothetical protein
VPVSGRIGVDGCGATVADGFALAFDGGGEDGLRAGRLDGGTVLDGLAVGALLDGLAVGALLDGLVGPLLDLGAAVQPATSASRPADAAATRTLMDARVPESRVRLAQAGGIRPVGAVRYECPQPSAGWRSVSVLDRRLNSRPAGEVTCDQAASQTFSS